MGTNSSPVSAGTLFWMYLGLGGNAILRRSLADEISGELPFSPLMSSPFVCAGEIIVTCYYWIRYGYFGTLGWRASSRLLLADSQILPAELVFNLSEECDQTEKTRDQTEHIGWAPMINLVLANILAVVPQLKIIGIQGLPWLFYVTLGLLTVAPLFRLVACWKGTMEIRPDQRKRLAKTCSSEPFLARMTTVDRIFNLSTSTQLTAWFGMCLSRRITDFVPIVLTALFVLLGTFAILLHYLHHPRFSSHLRWALKPVLFIFVVWQGVYEFDKFNCLDGPSRWWGGVTKGAVFFGGSVMLSDSGFYISPFEDPFYRPSLFLRYTINRPMLRKTLAWVFLGINIITTVVYLFVFYDEEGTNQLSWTSILG